MRWSSFLRILFALFAVELAAFGVFFRAPAAPARPPRGAPPVPDSDGDGIPDATDACLREAEDLDAFADDDGCPELDNDGDKVVDAADDCANEPSSLRSDGCPGSMCRGPFPPVALPGIPKRIYFEYRAAEIKAGWFPVLDAVAAKIKGDPARFPVVEIVGAIASAEAGSLASARAQAVRAALVARGVPGERLKVTPSTGGAGVPKVSFRVPRPGRQPGAVPDADGDGITDPWDACPRKPEVFNGFWDEDGCPDIDIDDRPTRYSLDPIYFAGNSDDPSPPSDDWLDDMANLLMARPYIRRLDIFGVASSDEHDPGRLAAARARAVERHLTYYGVEPERLQVRTESWRSLRVADGKRSRDRDRRVEFVWASVTDDVPIEVTAEVWQPIAPAFAVGGLSLPDLDMRAWPAEVQTAWRERKKDPPAAAAVFERARGRLDAGGWLALAEIRSDLAMAEHAKQADDPWFDAFTTLDAYARVEQLAPGGATAAIARYYSAEILADRVPEKADRMFRDVVTSKAPVKFRIAALLQAGAAAFAAHRWSEAADRLGGAIALSRARPGSFGSMDAPAWLQASALYRARRYREALALVEREAAAFPPGDEREKMLDLAAAALEALGRAAPAAASARFGPRLDAIRREDGAAERDVGKVTAAIVARCVRATATPCEATSSIFGGVPPSCGVLTLEVQSDARGGVRTEVLDRGSFTDTRRSFLACLDGTHPAVYGSGLPRASRARANVRVTNR